MSEAANEYVVATDVGGTCTGTCTDTVVFAVGEPIQLGKALSTPPNFADGVMASIASAAHAMDLSTTDLLAATRLFIHGTTVIDNAILTRQGPRTGLITTEGFEGHPPRDAWPLRALGRPERGWNQARDRDRPGGAAG